MPDNNYRYLKDLQNNVIKPVTDLAAVNLTTANGLLVNGNTIGVENGYVASCAYLELTAPATAASPDSAYIEGGGVLRLLGGYTSTDETTPITRASNEGASSEYSVRGAVNLNAIAEPSDGLTVNSAGIGVVAGDTIDLTGGTVNAKVADVDEVLTGLISGSTVTDKVEVVTPDNLRGALSVGQSVDVSCPPITAKNAFSYQDPALGFLGPMTVTDTINAYSPGFGWSATDTFQKYASGLKYLFILDIKNVSSDQRTWRVRSYAENSLYSDLPYNSTMRLYGISTDGHKMGFEVNYENGAASGETFTFEVTNWRQYEVTALTDEAIAYLAQLPNPDDFFRSTSAYLIRAKYLVKQDMVCPFIPTISMPDNSDLTIGAGLSYKIKYTDNNIHKISVATIPVAAYGWDAHIQLFITETSSIQFQPPLVLMNPLTANADHNLSVKFRNGQAMVYVEDSTSVR